MCVTGRCGAVTRNSDERHSRDQAGCAIKWTVAILESPASPHDPTQPPPKRRAGQSFTRGGDGSQSIPGPQRQFIATSFSASLERCHHANPEFFRRLPRARTKSYYYRDRMMMTTWKTSSAGILPAVPRASRPRRGERRRPPDSRRDGGATLSATSFFSPSGTNPCSRGNCRRSGGLFPGLFHPGGGGIYLGSPSRGSSAPPSSFRELGCRRR